MRRRLVPPRLLSSALVALAGLLGALAQSASAQQLTTPPEWRWRLDRPAQLVTGEDVPEAAWRFVSMAPGWHITTGPGVVLFHPQERATGRYSLVADFLLFPDPSDSPFGIVFGGTDLQSPNGSSLAVQLRRDGAARIIATAAGVERELVPWQVHSAIKPHSGGGVVGNRVRVAVGTDSLRLFVNDSATVAVATTGLVTHGQFGMRIGERLNFHITTLDHVRHLAPARR
ncbi:MAG: hypothetical protein IPF98_04390 [Gemmatimonadetes bacterium]|nr:hypothetical protein [Gemmatimonadota bacterium]